MEILKVLDRKQPIEVYKNCFLNLALPVLLLSEPGAVEKTVIKFVKLCFYFSMSIPEINL